MSMESRIEVSEALKKAREYELKKYNRRSKPAETIFPCMRTHRVDQ